MEHERPLGEEMGNEDPTPGLCDSPTGWLWTRPLLGISTPEPVKMKKRTHFPIFTRCFVIISEVRYINML